MTKTAMFVAVLMAAAALGLPHVVGETVVPKGMYTSSADVARDPATGLPLVNPIKNPSPQHGSPRGDRL